EDQEGDPAPSDHAVPLAYLQELRDAPRGSERSRAWEEIFDIRDELQDEGDLGTEYVAWRTARLADADEADPQTLVAAYLEELDAAGDQESTGRRDLIRSLLVRSGAESRPAP